MTGASVLGPAFLSREVISLIHSPPRHTSNRSSLPLHLLPTSGSTQCPLKHKGEGITYERVSRCECKMLDTSHFVLVGLSHSFNCSIPGQVRKLPSHQITWSDFDAFRSSELEDLHTFCHHRKLQVLFRFPFATLVTHTPSTSDRHIRFMTGGSREW